MEWGFVAGTVVCVFGASYWMTKVVYRLLLRRAVLDLPNERSSHMAPTPRGGGLAIVAVVVLSMALVEMAGFPVMAYALLMASLFVVLAAVSWIDDLRGLPPVVRLGVHLIVVTLALAFGIEGPFLGGLLPDWMDPIVAGLAWIWFINLFNFMDGTDGIAGVEAISVFLGIALVLALPDAGGGPALVGLIVAAATLGFLILNWHPAKIFLGDVGSIPLGFILGWLLLVTAADGHLAAAVILPLYFVFDATWTLLRRVLLGERVWQAHRQHFYQRAVQGGLGHDAVAKAVALANVLLIALAVATLRFDWYPLIGAVIVVGGLVFYLAAYRLLARPGDRQP